MGFDFRSTGFLAGADYRLTDNIVLGAAVGHSNSNAHFADDTARLHTNTNTGSLYASYYNRAFFVDLIGTFSHIKYDEQRTTSFTVDPTVVTTLPANCLADGTCFDNTTGSTS